MPEDKSTFDPSMFRTLDEMREAYPEEAKNFKVAEDGNGFVRESAIDDINEAQEFAAEEAMKMQEKISVGETADYNEAEKQVESDQEFEPIEKLQERIRNTIANLYLIPLPHISVEECSIIHPKMLIIALQNLEEIITQLSETHADRIGEVAGELHDEAYRHTRLADQWNKFLNYDNIILSIMACMDRDGQLQKALKGYLNDIANAIDITEDERLEERLSEEPFSTLVNRIRSSTLLDGLEILEIGGSGMADLSRENISGQPKDVICTSSKKNEDTFVSPWVLEERITKDTEDHVTFENYREFYGDKKFDITTSRMVFDPGSGIQTGKMTENDSIRDLLKVMSALTKEGGYSIHEGALADFDEQFLETIGLEKVMVIEVLETEFGGYTEEDLHRLVEGQSENEIIDTSRKSSYRKSNIYFQKVSDGKIRVSNEGQNGRFVCILRKIS